MSAFDKEKTMTDMEFVPLLQKDVALRQAKMGIWFSTGNMKQFNESFFYWKKDYRGRYSEKYLERSGFEPVAPGYAVNIRTDDLKNYLATKDPAITTIKTYGVSVPSADLVARRFLHYNGYAWTNHTNTLVLGGITYDQITTVFNSDESKVDITFSQSTGTQDYNMSINNDFNGITSLTSTFGSSGQPDEFYRVYLENSVTVPWDSLGTTSDITMSAIVPIKENDEFKEETVDLKRMLNRFGLGGGDLIDSLTEDEEGNPSKVDNAYIMEGLPFDTQDDRTASYDVKNSLAMALYRSFEYLSRDSAKSFSMAELNMTYNFDVAIETIGGIPPNVVTGLEGEEEEKELKVGDYMAILPGAEDGEDGGDYDDESYDPFEGLVKGEGTSDSIYELYYRESPSVYKKMTISNYSQTFMISGKSFTSYLDSDSAEGRLLIPLEVLNELKFKNFVAVHERSFVLLAYATETYTIKWYQRGIFQFLFTLVITYFTAGTATAFIQTLINAAINFAIAFAVGMLVSMIDNEFLALIVTIALFVLVQWNQGFDFTNMTVENYLPMADKVIRNSSNVYGDYVQEQMKKIAEEAEKQKEEDEELLATMKPGFEVTNAMLDAHFSFMDVNGAGTWINQMLGENLVNFEQFFDSTAEIELRKQVTPG